MTYSNIGRLWIFYIYWGIIVLHVFTSLLGGVPLCIFLGIVQWNFTRRDHSGNPRRVSGSGPVRFSS